MKSLQWIAIYADGTALREYQDGRKNAYESIDRPRVVRLEGWRDGYARKVFEMDVRPGERFFYRRRELRRLGGQPLQEVYIFGVWWRDRDRSVHWKTAYIHENDTVTWGDVQDVQLLAMEAGRGD